MCRWNQPDSKKWVRLVGQTVPGCLSLKETCYPDGKEAALLDVFEAELGYSCGSNCHPEDVLVSDSPGSHSDVSTSLAMRAFSPPT